MHSPYQVGAAKMLGKSVDQTTEAEQLLFRSALLDMLVYAGRNGLIDNLENDMEAMAQSMKGKNDGKH